MLARKLIMLACLLCAGSAFATELDEAVKGAMSDDYTGIVADKTFDATEIVNEPETIAGGAEQSGPSGEEGTGDSRS